MKKKIKRLQKASAGLQDVVVPQGGSVGGIASSATSMASTGASLIPGPWGAAAGAVVGLGMGIIQKNKQDDAKRAAEKLNSEKAVQRKYDGTDATVNQSTQEFKTGTESMAKTKPIEVEKDELIFSKIGKHFKLKADFKGGKTHEQGGEPYVAKEGDVIFPGKQRNKVLDAYNRKDHTRLESMRMMLPKDTNPKGEAKAGLDNEPGGRPIDALLDLFSGKTDIDMREDTKPDFLRDDLVNEDPPSFNDKKAAQERNKEGWISVGDGWKSKKTGYIYRADGTVYDLENKREGKYVKEGKNWKTTFVEPTALKDSEKAFKADLERKAKDAGKTPAEIARDRGATEHEIKRMFPGSEKQQENVTSSNSNNTSVNTPSVATDNTTVQGGGGNVAGGTSGGGTTTPVAGTAQANAAKIAKDKAAAEAKKVAAEAEAKKDAFRQKQVLWGMDDTLADGKDGPTSQKYKKAFEDKQLADINANRATDTPNLSNGKGGIDDVKAVAETGREKYEARMASIDPKTLGNDKANELPENEGVKKDEKLGNALKYAGIANNLIESFKKPDAVQENYVKPENLKYTDRSGTMRKEVDKATGLAAKNAGMAAGGNAANVRANAQQARMAGLEQKEKINNQEQARADQIDNINIQAKNQANQVNVGLQNQYAQQKSANLAAKEAYRGQAMSDIASVAQMNTQAKNMKELDDKKLAMEKSTLGLISQGFASFGAKYNGTSADIEFKGAEKKRQGTRAIKVKSKSNIKRKK